MSQSNQGQDDLRAAIKMNTRVTMALLVLFILQAVGFGIYAYSEYRRLTRPKNLVSMAEEAIEENYSEIRKTIKEEMVKSAPKIAERMSKRAVARAPEARARAEKFLGRQMAWGLDEVTELSADQFRELLRSNDALVKKGFRELKEVPDEAKAFVLELEKMLEKALGTNIRRDARVVLAAHMLLNDKLEYLARAKDLEPREMVERRMVRILRTIQLRDKSKPKG